MRNGRAKEQHQQATLVAKIDLSDQAAIMQNQRHSFGHKGAQLCVIHLLGKGEKDHTDGAKFGAHGQIENTFWNKWCEVGAREWGRRQEVLVASVATLRGKGRVYNFIRQ